MIRSMTAFASCEDTVAGFRISWEMRSVNHRYLDLSARLPDDLRGIEPQLRKRVGAHLKRGKLECALHCQPDQHQQQPIQVNMDRVRELLKAVQQVEVELGASQALKALEVLNYPGVQEEPPEDSDTLKQAVLKLLEQTVLQMVAAREREGEQIQGLIEDRCQRIQEQVELARQRLPEVLQAVREKITLKIQDLVANPDQDRIEQELVLLAQKMDVDEEMDRLDGHVQEVRRVLAQREPVGRRLDFLMQEMTREANTLGSKSVDKQTTAISIELKVLIEQMREQIQNVE